MDIQGRVVVVTGAGRGIGAAMCRQFAAAGAEFVVVSDRDEAAAVSVANGLGVVGLAVRCDVAVESDVQGLVGQVLERSGRIDIFCANAGITVKGGVESTNAEWQRMWDVNVMSRIYAARAVVPGMLQRGGRLLCADRICCGVADGDWFSGVFGDEACGFGVSGVVIGVLWAGGYSSIMCVSAGCGDGHAG